MTQQILYKATPDGVVEFTAADYVEHAALQAEMLAQEPIRIRNEITGQVQQRLDNFARTRNYDNILSACTYATSNVPKFAQEGQRCVNLRDATWNAMYVYISEVEAGTRPMPTGYADVEPLLPTLSWS